MPDRLPKDRAGRLVMVLIVRNEDDILETNLRYHRALGVDQFVVTDNGSTDTTPQILSRFADAGLVHVIEEPGTNFPEEERNWLTRMARLAASELGADWILYNDADEFWLPAEGSLRETLASIPERYGAVVAPRTEFVGRPDGPGTFAERLTVREAWSRAQPKLAHRAVQDVIAIDRGGHTVAVEGETGDVADTLRPPGRPVHRMVREPEAQETILEEDETRLVWAPIWRLRILHFPVRSLAQFERRAQVAVSANYPEWGRFERLRRDYEEGRVKEHYAALVLDDEEIEQGIREGRLVRDARLRELLGICPDPLAGGEPGTVRVEMTPHDLEHELSELEFDAMRLLGRTQGWLVLQRDRTRTRVEELQQERLGLRERNERLTGQRDRLRQQRARLRDRLARKRGRVKRLKQRLRAERSRPWSRARRAAGRLLRR